MEKRVYAPDYMPKDEALFAAMETVFATAESKDHLEQLMVCYIFDMSYDRHDIVVAAGRVERERGWK